MMLMNARTAAMGACVGLLGVLSIVSVAVAQVTPPPPRPKLCVCEPVTSCEGVLLTAHAHCESDQICTCEYTWNDDFTCVVSLVAYCTDFS